MKKRNLLLFLALANLTPFLQASCKIDSLVYPSYGIDAEGTRIVTIKRSQQFYLTNQVIELKKCTRIKDQQKKLISLLQDQNKDCELLNTSIDTIKEKNSIILQKKNKYILNLEKQLDAQKQISNSLYKENDIITKREKRKVIGWKIGTFVLVGVSIAALTTAAIIGIK